MPASAFTGQAFHRLAAATTEAGIDEAQLAIARASVERFELSADVLAFDTTNFDTFISTTTSGELARRGHAKSKRADLRVVGLGVLASETGHVPLLHRTYPGNTSDQEVLASCMGELGKLHAALGAAEDRPKAQRTIVRDGGFWREQLELELGVAGYGSLISLPLGHGAAEEALKQAAKRGAMKKLRGELADVRAARLRAPVGELERTLVVVESEELLRGQKRGISVALRKAKAKLRKLEKRVKAGRIDTNTLNLRIKQALAREHLGRFVVVKVGGDDKKPTMRWYVDAVQRRELENMRLGRRVLCTDRHLWGTERIVSGFRGQWNVEELFRRAKRGGISPWAPSHQWSDTSLRLHTFATVLGLTLVSLARIALGSKQSVNATMKGLAEIEATLVRVTTGAPGRRPTVMLAPDLSPAQRKAAATFDLGRWVPALLSCS